MLFDSRLTIAQKASFFAQLSAMLKAGMSLQHCLTLAGQHGQADFQKYLQQVTSHLMSGQDFASALTITKAAGYFDGWTLSLIRLGEYSGSLAEVCTQLSQDFLDQQFRDRLYQSIRFSTVSTCWCLLVLLSAIFHPHHVLMVDFWLRWLIWGVILFLLSVHYGGYLANKFQFIPVVSKLIEAQRMIYFSWLALPIKCGITILTGLELLRSRFPQMAKVLQTSTKQVAQGQTLSSSLQGKIPTLVLQMIVTGEETGYLDLALEKVRNYYIQELERLLKQLQGVLRPVSILAMGGIVLIVSMQLLKNFTQALP